MKPMTPTMNPPRHIDIEQQGSDTKDRSDACSSVGTQEGRLGEAFVPLLEAVVLNTFAFG